MLCYGVIERNGALCCAVLAWCDVVYIQFSPTCVCLVGQGRGPLLGLTPQERVLVLLREEACVACAYMYGWCQFWCRARILLLSRWHFEQQGVGHPSSLLPSALVSMGSCGEEGREDRNCSSMTVRRGPWVCSVATSPVPSLCRNKCASKDSSGLQTATRDAQRMRRCCC